MEERKMRKMKIEGRFSLRELERTSVFVRENENVVKKVYLCVCVCVCVRTRALVS